MFLLSRVRIFVAAKSVDFRKDHYGLATLVKNELCKEPSIRSSPAAVPQTKIYSRQGVDRDPPTLAG